MPHILPDGTGVIFTVRTQGDPRIALLSFESGEWEVLQQLGEATDARYVPTGHLVYAQSDALVAVPFDVGAAW